MTKALSILIQSLVMFIASHEYAEASQILAGSALFFFDGVATLGLLMSGLLVLLGYKLLNGMGGPGGEIHAGVNAFKVRVTQAVPGVVSAVLGLAGVLACMSAMYAVN
ncbi:hypothetical protein GOL88_29325 [Sinorhizobium medicae]|nr:hypothetical protein [Sinorhizobium medicae]